MNDSLPIRAAKAITRATRRAIIRHAGFVFARHLPISMQPTLIIAPHPDDEVLGAGGLIALKRLRGAPVHILYLTEGEGALRAFNADPDDVAQHRHALGQNACASLGVDANCLHRLYLPDGAIPAPASACFTHVVDSVERIIARYNIQEVYCTHPADGWDDHINAAAIARAAVGNAMQNNSAHGSPALYDYPVWSWHSLNTRGIFSMGWGRANQINIDTVTHLKQHATDQYLSIDDAIDPVTSKPYCGVLPSGLLRAMNWTHELYFRVSDHELLASASVLNQTNHATSRAA